MGVGKGVNGGRFILLQGALTLTFLFFALMLVSSIMAAAAPISSCSVTKHSDEVGADAAYNCCQLATHQGRRRYQEDRMLCARETFALGSGGVAGSDVSGTTTTTTTSVRIAAVFDGHNGAEASELASVLLPKYFSRHVNSLLHSASPSPCGLILEARVHHTCDMISSVPIMTSSELPSLPADAMEYSYPCNCSHNAEREASTSTSSVPRSVYMEILKESLKRAIYDLDSTFTKDALEHEWKSGSTAAVVLMLDGEILAANVGDSKAVLCSESANPPNNVRADLAKLRRRERRTPAGEREGRSSPKKEKSSSSIPDDRCLLAEELTEDHHPDVDAERIRVEAAGGYVEEWAGVARVNGQLAVSRSIGDVHFKRYGVISTPHVSEWRHISSNDRYLVLGSDGIFEKMTPQQVCNLLWINANQDGGDQMAAAAEGSSSSSCADYIVDFAFRSGTTDNMSAIVVALASNATMSSV